MPAILETKIDKQLIRPRDLDMGELAVIVEWSHMTNHRHCGNIVIMCPKGDLMVVEGGPKQYWGSMGLQSLDDGFSVRRLQPGEKVVVIE